METLSELEGVVLGLVGLRQPVTSYRVRAEIAASRSSHWRGSAGSVYPAVQRLVARRLLRSAPRPRDGRGGLALQLTRLGRRGLDRWIGSPFPGWIGAPTFDPIRTRVTFLGRLGITARRRMLNAAESAVKRELASALDYARSEIEDNVPWERLIALGTIEELRGRLRWIRIVKSTLKKLGRGTTRSK